MENDMDRRTFLGTAAAAAAAGACSSLPNHPPAPAMDVAAFHAKRRFANTPSGRIAYVEQGSGPVALFLHGVILNGFHWRHVMAGVQDLRRCIALDSMGMGYSEIAAGQDVSMTAQARMVGQVLDVLGIDQVDLVGNDTGGGTAQVFAAGNPGRVRSLTLTNCDTHDNWPSETLRPLIEAARKGVLLDAYRKLLDDPQARRTRFARAFADPGVLTDEVFRTYIEPLGTTQERRDSFHRYWTSFDNSQTVAIEPKLRALRSPALVVWGLDDEFFDVKWAHWLKKTIPGVQRVVEVPGAKLFFPEDRPQALIGPLRELLSRV
jgi:pimeloyl-ACP methyl ester carboxylesterase